MKLRRVVVTGLGAITPLGKTVPDYWEGLRNGVSGAAPITHFDTSKFKTKFACEVKDFDGKDYFDRKELRTYDLVCQYGMITAMEAMQDSGLNLEKVDCDRGGVIWGSGIGGLNTFLKELSGFATGDGTPRFNPFFIPKMIADITAGNISIKYGLRGPNYATVSACASSANALIDAFNFIRMGKAEFFLSGGSEAAINEAGVGGFNAMHAISTRNDDPLTASRPFDKDRDGFVLGEGGACLMLEDLEHAKARGAKIYAEVVGGGVSGDANHMTSPHPEGVGASLAMKMAINDANIKPEEIDYINTHGTSTPLGDIAEPKAILRTFGDHAYKIFINSSKSMIGHLLGAAGAAEAIASIMAINHNFIHPTINHFTDDPEIDNNLTIVYNKGVDKEVNTVLSNAFGFGGHNASLIFKRYSD